MEVYDDSGNQGRNDNKNKYLFTSYLKMDIIENDLFTIIGGLAAVVAIFFKSYDVVYNLVVPYTTPGDASAIGILGPILFMLTALTLFNTKKINDIDGENE